MNREQAHDFASLIMRTYPQIKSYLRKTFAPGPDAVGFYKIMLDDLEQLDHKLALETLKSWKLQTDLKPEQVTATAQQIRNGVRERERIAASMAKGDEQQEVMRKKTVRDVLGYRAAQVQEIMQPLHSKLLREELCEQEYNLVFDRVWEYYDRNQDNNAPELLKQYGQPVPARA